MPLRFQRILFKNKQPTTYINVYIYIYIYVCVCVCVCVINIKLLYTVAHNYDVINNILAIYRQGISFEKKNSLELPLL